MPSGGAHFFPWTIQGAQAIKVDTKLVDNCSCEVNLSISYYNVNQECQIGMESTGFLSLMLSSYAKRLMGSYHTAKP